MEGMLVADGRSVTIYVLMEEDTRAIRYVGKTVVPLYRRRIQHQYFARSRSRKTWLANWIRSLERNGRTFRIVGVETVPAGGNWHDAERQWIYHLRQAGCRLVNATDGGEGLSGHVFTDEHRRRISEALWSQIDRNCLNCCKPFTAKPSDIAKGDGKFCSRHCYQSWQRGKAKNVVSEHYGRAGRDAAAAKRRSQSECKRGHALSGDNLYVSPSGTRICKECRKLHKEAYRVKQN